MTMTRLLAFAATLASIVSCSHPIEIRGMGDVRSESGSRDCTLEAFQAGSESCRKNAVTNDYKETYYAEARAGWEFGGWLNYCGDATDNSCSFDVPASIVNKNWGAVAPPLVAVFKRVMPEVKREILADITGRYPYGDEVGVGYAYVCPGAATSRSFLIDVPGIDPTVKNRQPSAAGLDSACGSDSRQLNFHRIYLTWSNGADYIQRNAGFVRSALELIAKKYALAGDDKVALVGTSMGGVVSRYALLQMENEAVNHLVDLFVTVDSPHTGAYVPIGIQHIANIFASKGGDEALVEVNSPAARQLLRYHYKQGDAPQTYSGEYRTLYLDELEALGGYPRAPGLRTVAVASGRGDGVQVRPLAGERYLDASLELFSKSYSVEKTFDLLITKYTFKVSYKIALSVEVSAWALSPEQAGRSRVARVDVDATVNGISSNDKEKLTAYFRSEVSRITGVSTKLIPKFIVSSIVSIVSNKVADEIAGRGGKYDNKDFYASNDGRTSAGVPGGLGNSIRKLRAILQKENFKLAGARAEDTPLNPFIPTASALGVGSAGIGADDVGPDLSYTREEWQAASPFHAVYVESGDNEDHTESTTGWERELTALFESAP